jgi:hypothetical protein
MWMGKYRYRIENEEERLTFLCLRLSIDVLSGRGGAGEGDTLLPLQTWTPWS